VNKRIIIGVVTAAVVAVAVLVGINLLGGDDDADGIQGVDEVNALFEGLPQSGNTVGPADAPVEIIEYGDTSCPACKAASETIVPELIQGPVAEGRAKMTFRPIAFINASSERGALGAEAAALQDAMWPFVELVFKNQGPESEDWLTDDLMFQMAGDLGLDADQWQSDYQGEEVASSFFERSEAAAQDQVSATPTFIVRGPRGEERVEGFDLEDFEAAIAEVGPAA
jgi:protein-disulfide isomerase